jgi:hypothetical protein
MAGFSRCAGSDLDAAGRRRMWIVELVLEGGAHRNPADALELAVRFERFINIGLDHCESDPHASTSCVTPKLASPFASAGWTEASTALRSQAPARHGTLPRPSETNGAVAAGPATRAANGALPMRLRHSMGRAQAGRLNLAQQRPRSKGKSAAANQHLSRDAELALEEEFLRQRAPAPCTIDDVIRFLRQRGDSVVTHEGGYLVNERLMLTRELMISRANRQRKHMGVPLFTIGSADIASLEAAAPSL